MYEVKAQLALRLKEPTNIKITTPIDIAAVVDDMRDLAQESFQVLTIDAQNKLIDRHLISLGTVSSALVHPRETFRPAILDGASVIALIHNHPSGNPTPSPEDIKVTKQLIGAGEIIGIKVIDHIILGDRKTSARSYISLRESGLCTFK